VDPLRRRSAGLRAAGALLAGGGLGVALAGVAAFRRRRTTVDPRHPERASTLVTDGVYRWTRNPMYVGVVGVALGGTTALGSPLGVLGPVLLSLYLDRVQIPAEEAALRSHFGADYDTYAQTVGRWLGPAGADANLVRARIE
jgi:protein-S-isoprenylcysteine O-methyltransferase Ste14